MFSKVSLEQSLHECAVQYHKQEFAQTKIIFLWYFGRYEGLKGYTPHVTQDSMNDSGRAQYVNTLYRAEYLVSDIYNQEIAIANVHFKALTVMQVSISPTAFTIIWSNKLDFCAFNVKCQFLVQLPLWLAGEFDFRWVAALPRPG